MELPEPRNWPVTRVLGHPLTEKEMMDAYEKLSAQAWAMPVEPYFEWVEEPDGLRSRHQDYLPLNLWDETPDE